MRRTIARDGGTFGDHCRCARKHCAKFHREPLDMVAGEKSTIEASGPLTDARLWSPDDPNLYDVYTVLTVEGKVVDVVKTTTGFRKTEFQRWRWNRRRFH